jgi:hypothetical protein
VKLTAAGYLPPAVVQTVFDELDMGDQWIGQHRPTARSAAGRDLPPPDGRSRRTPSEGAHRGRGTARRTGLDGDGPRHPVRHLRPRRHPGRPDHRTPAHRRALHRAARDPRRPTITQTGTTRGEGPSPDDAFRVLGRVARRPPRRPSPPPILTPDASRRQRCPTPHGPHHARPHVRLLTTHTPKAHRMVTALAAVACQIVRDRTRPVVGEDPRCPARRSAVASVHQRVGGSDERARSGHRGTRPT